MFDVLGHSAASALRLDKEHIEDSMIRTYDWWVGANTESLERDMHWLLIHLYYLGLKYIPGIVKNWWLACQNRQTSLAVQAWTEKYFTHLIVQDLLDDVVKWSEDQKVDSDDDGKPLSVRVFRASREVVAGYEIDDMWMKILIRIRATYPLAVTTVESIFRVGIPEKKWVEFISITKGVIQFAVRISLL
jgi:E3 ubiquitin-protein ligase listerin